MYMIQFWDDSSDAGEMLHETQCPLGSPLPGINDTVGFDDRLFSVLGLAFDYSKGGAAPTVIIRVDDF